MGLLGGKADGFWSMSMCTHKLEESKESTATTLEQRQ